jgi:uncharacterized damage-inducible protein DinB
MKLLSNANVEVLNQLKELISLCESIYVKSPDSQHAGIGQHVRHVLDHYRAFKLGVDDKCVDYNLRTRNSHEETDSLVAQHNIDELIIWLQSYSGDYLELTVISEISLREAKTESMNSNTERELLYLINHSIHHMAYASLLASSKGIELPRHIGLAPGTASYERELIKEPEQDYA